MATQLDRIRLDPAEHDEWRLRAFTEWAAHLNSSRLTRLNALQHARATGTTAYLHQGEPA
ncbi:hypothetical protein ACWD5V_15650 [Streptomyces sp. NPDC002523]